MILQHHAGVASDKIGKMEKYPSFTNIWPTHRAGQMRLNPMTELGKLGPNPLGRPGRESVVGIVVSQLSIMA